jgi:hypothetical protein
LQHRLTETQAVERIAKSCHALRSRNRVIALVTLFLP